MADSIKQFGLRMMSGEDKSFSAAVWRGATLLIEPFYRATMSARNLLYDCGIFKTHTLNRSTISVGNITAGGTGKTPVVAWLAKELRRLNRHPAVLLRGYGAGKFSDEAQLLNNELNVVGSSPIRVLANPSRIAGAKQVLLENPQTDVFVLDDAFQHRKAGRDCNLVLISATRPFGFGHVLPRGLLRESPAGLNRADAFLITRCSLVSGSEIEKIETHLHSHHPSIPIFHCDHQITSIWEPMLNQSSSPQSLEGKRVFLTAGIGDPQSLSRQMAALGCIIVGQRWFSDHHDYTRDEITSMKKSAEGLAADIILTTEKDWVKMESKMPPTGEVNIGVVKMQIAFHNDSE